VRTQTLTQQITSSILNWAAASSDTIN